MILNDIAGLINLDFDDKGEIARQGKMIPELIKDLSAIEYYQIQGPKSLGQEEYRKYYHKLCFAHKENIEDLLLLAANILRIKFPWP